MPPLDYLQLARGVDLGHRVVVAHGALGKGAERVEPCHGIRRGLYTVDLFRHAQAHLGEVLVLQLVHPVARRQQRRLKLFELGGEIALTRNERLLAYVFFRDLFKPGGIGHIDVIAEHAVVADLQLLRAGALTLARLQLLHHLRAVVADVAQPVYLFGIARAQHAALAHGKRRLVAYRAVYLRAHVVKRVHPRDAPQLCALKRGEQLLEPRQHRRAVRERAQVAPAGRAVYRAAYKPLHVRYLAQHRHQLAARDVV